MEVDDEEKNDFQPREYQQEMLELAIKKNLILYLPTGSGKTFIAIMLLKNLAQNTDLSQDIRTGGKRSFFLVNTVALVDQQSKTLTTHTPFNVGKYSGDMGVDLWDREKWHHELNLYQVVVLTCQIFLDLIQHSTISLNNANLLIFDECHRAVSNHPFRQIMKMFKEFPSSQHPRVLGLTATLLNGNINPKSVTDEIKTLETTMMAQIATSSNDALVRLHSTNPIEKSVLYIENNTTGYLYTYRDQCLGECQTFVDQTQIEEIVDVPFGLKPDKAKQIDMKKNKTNKRLKNLIEDIKVNMDDLGAFGGSMSVLVHMIQLEQMLPFCVSNISKLIYQFILSQCTKLRRVMYKEMEQNCVSPLDQMRKFSSDKVLQLFTVLKLMKPTDTGIIFVKRRFTAKILYYVLKNAAAVDPQLSHIKSNYIVGYNIGNPFKDTRENYVQRAQNKKVMNLFNQGELNVLVASNVVEEGIDITQCNYVVMFDLPQDFRGYVQSKGRARDKNSHYLLMISRTDHVFLNKYNNYREIESNLQEILCWGKALLRKGPTQEEINNSLFQEEPGLEPFMPLGSTGPVVTALSAISLINRYFASLKHDKFTKITPFWWIQEENNKYKCFLQLPMESQVRGRVEGTWQASKENAKRSVALEACKKLYTVGELDQDTILPRGWENPPIPKSEFTPNMDNSYTSDVEELNGKTYTVGTKKYKRTYQKEWADCLKQCRPVVGKECYLHVIYTKPVFKVPIDNHRLQVVYDILESDCFLAILSAKKLPQLASFPLFMNTGELECNIGTAQLVSLNQEEINLINEYHAIVFEKLLRVTKPFMLRDFSNDFNSYLIAPVIPGDSGEMIINWTAIKEAFEPFPSSEIRPSPEERERMIITQEKYLYKIVSPWYRSVAATNYIVTEVCTDMNENSPFPSENFDTYKEYFQEKYKIQPLVENQPLIEVRALSSRLNSIVPRALTKQIWRSKNKEENEEFEVWLLPEFCVLYPVSGHYWLQALLLPSVLHRLGQLCMAEQLRCIINHQTGVGSRELPPGVKWEKLKEDISIAKKEKVVEMEQALTPLPICITNPTNSAFKTPWEGEREPIDIERDVEGVTLFDILYYKTFIEKPLAGNNNEEDLRRSLRNIKEVSVPKDVQAPSLEMLQKTPKDLGPQQVELMQALITAGANDFVNCERLETLGDAFLKFAISLSLFEFHPDMSEGHLTNIKGAIVGNKNLYHCGLKKNLGPIIQAHDFSPNAEWVPPGFCVERSIQSVIRVAKLSPNVLYNIDIPYEDIKRGRLSKETKGRIGDILSEGEDMESPQNSMFINQEALTDKNVSDGVESILGTYLKGSGLFGALAVLKWFGVTSDKYCTPEIFTRASRNPARGKGNPGQHLLEPAKLEKIIGYKFKNRCYLLEALCHPSYTNHITVPYQRLEFLGDAIIDFLITVHIYEKCTNLSPGDLTDLRSALVNNITLACIVVRHGLNRFLLQQSSLLTTILQRFVRHQESREHIIDDDILFLYEEGSINISESIEVPKALGDIFEALVGAVYLDSGKSLDVAWKMVYRFMHQEIDKFSKTVPKNHVRMLYESNCSPAFHSSVQTNGAVMVDVEIMHKGKTMKFSGFGDNKKQAKRAAAKHAMRFLRTPSTA